MFKCEFQVRAVELINGDGKLKNINITDYQLLLLYGWVFMRTLAMILGVLDSNIIVCIHWQPTYQAANVLTACH